MVNVASAAANTLVLGGPATAIAGSPALLSVAVVDRFGNLAAGYSGTLHVSSSDSQALLPSDGSFYNSDLPVTWITAGSQQLSVADLGNANLFASLGNITVLAGR